MVFPVLVEFCVGTLLWLLAIAAVVKVERVQSPCTYCRRRHSGQDKVKLISQYMRACWHTSSLRWYLQHFSASHLRYAPTPAVGCIIANYRPTETSY